MTVVWLASLVLFQGVDPNAEVAFTARFYYPPGDKRISKHQVYVSRLDGSKRRQVTFGSKDVHEVLWVGRDRLVWTEDGQLVIYDLASSKVVNRLKSKGATFYDSTERGYPRLWKDERILDPDGSIRSKPPSATLSLWDGGQMKLGRGHVLRFSSNNQPNPWKYSLDGKAMSVTLQGTPGFTRG